MLGPVLFNVFASDLDNELKCMLKKSVNDTR